MTEQDAIEIASKEIKRQKIRVGSGPVYALFKQRHMRLGKNRSGWLVVFPLDVPASFEPNSLDVEVYEPDGAVNVVQSL